MTSIRTMKTIIAVAVLVFSTAAFAAQPSKETMEAKEAKEDAARTVKGGASRGVKACHEDIEKRCKGVEPGEGRLGECLKANKAKLSKKCRRWARHGGAAHEDEALTDIDRSAN